MHLTQHTVIHLTHHTVIHLTHHTVIYLTHLITVGLIRTIRTVLVVVTDLGRMDASAVVTLKLARGAVIGTALFRFVRVVTAVILETSSVHFKHYRTVQNRMLL